MVFFLASVSYFDKWNIWIPFLIMDMYNRCTDQHDDNTRLSRELPSIQFVWQPGNRPKLLFPCIICTCYISIPQRVWRKIIFNNNQKLTKYRNLHNLRNREIGLTR